MSWIKSIPRHEALGKLRQVYDRIAGKHGAIDNILTVHGQRPHTLEGHMALYKRVLHSRENTLPKWKLELLGVYVSLLNRCAYCVSHHEAGLRRLLQDDARADALRGVLDRAAAAAPLQAPSAAGDRLTVADAAMLGYAGKLTLAPAEVTEADVAALLATGFAEGEVLEINQVVSYFAYANRTVLGLGVSLDGDVLGLSPGDSEDPDNWQHDEARE